MILNKLVYDVREALKQYSDDSEIDNSYIIYLYNIKRSKFLRRDINNNLSKPIDNSILQNFCEKVVKTSKLECSLDFDCGTIMRTKRPIPTPLQLHSKSAVVRVGSPEIMSKPFNFISRSKAIYSLNSPFSNSIFSFLHNDGHIYFISGSKTIKLLKYVNITGVFENPLELIKYNKCIDCGDISAYDEMTTDYPIQPHYIDLIKNEIVKDLIQLLQIPEDKINDGTN